ETVALTGPTGSGKSSILRALVRLDDLLSGTVTFAGTPLADAEWAQVRRRVGYVPQRPVLLSGTIAENLGLGLEPPPGAERLREACRAAAIDDHIDSLPEGYETLVGEGGTTLSGGQVQRLAIARALLAGTPVILLDDVTSAVDTGTEATILDGLRRIDPDVALVVVTHRPAVLDMADRVVTLAEAGSLAVEELAKRSRTMRDLLDPTGAESRSARRYQGREFRMWIDAEGQHRARIAFDDEMALWLRTVRDSALRPRRGGPRFVIADDRAAADELARDPRSNEQLEYDLVMDLIRAGALASHEDVFGARQPGVRMIVVKDVVGPRDPLGRLLAVGHAEDGGDALAGSIIDRALCMHGSRIVTTDGHGNPLDVGREQRLYTARQRIALAARDGGCLWPECNRPASSCEAHHCDHFGEHGGRTDIDRGVLLCRFHHMLLHNRGWRITRDGHGPFILHPPPGEGSPRALVSKAAWRWAWDPPPPAERGGWRHPDVAREPAGARPG
ncbi:MAG: ATP-binding cassette domain-containing protein, partial [Microbacterium sp.]|nr:ATP-binding cassette domain-containing protein [Microbacterium sp.]